MHNLQEALNPGGSDQAARPRLDAEETETVDKTERVIIVCNSLLKMRADPEGAATRGHSWHFEMDPNSIYGQSASGIVSGTSVEKVIFLGGLGSEVELFEQDAVAAITERSDAPSSSARSSRRSTTPGSASSTSGL